MRITKDGLILARLKGKHEAIGRYDAILWRTRAIVLIGSLYLASPSLAFAAYAVVRGAVWG